MTPAAQIFPLIAALEQLRPHEHLCSIYESPQEHFTVAVPFIRIGLDRGEKCIYITDDDSERDIRAAMRAEGIDVDRAVESNALTLTTKEQAYLKGGSFDPNWTFSFWKDATEQAMHEGFTALRGTGETEWVKRRLPGLDRWMEYESRLTHTLAEINCSALCQYDRQLFPPELLLDVIRTHPTVAYRGIVGRNLYHVPPDEFLGANRTEREIERLLTSIRERERVEHLLRLQRNELHESEQRFRLMVEGVKDYAMYSLDSGGRVTSWNVGAERIKGYREEEILGEHVARFYLPEDVARGVPGELLRAAAATGATEREGWRVRKNGTRFWADVTITALHNEEGALVGFSKLTRDITERRRAAEELRRNAAYLAEGQKISHTGSWAWNFATGELYWSLEHFRIFGLDPERTKPSYELFLQMLHPQDRVVVRQTFEDATHAASDFDSEYRIVRPDGVIRNIHSLSHPAFNESGELTEYVGTVVDVTEQRQAEEVLRKSQAELAHAARMMIMGELTASISHEINQPLAAVIANGNACLRWLAGKSPNMDEAREAVTRIIRDGKRASEVILRIRALLRKASVDKKWMDMNEIIQDVVTLARAELRRSDVVLRMDLAANLPPVMGDRVQLQQVVLNLIMNAIEAMSVSGAGARELVIDTTRHAVDQVRVTVRDTGIGIEQKDVDRIFDAFYTTKPEGMGIGLSISRSIIEAHNGRLWAVRNDGPGATFQFTLPANDPGWVARESGAA